MPDFGKLINKAKQMVGQHPDQVTKGIEKIEDLADKKTGGQYHDQVEKAGHAAANYLGEPGQDGPGGRQQRGPEGNQQGRDENQR